MLTDPDDPRHGTLNGYNGHKCRCRKCKDGWAAHARTDKRRQQLKAARTARQARWKDFLERSR